MNTLVSRKKTRHRQALDVDRIPIRRRRAVLTARPPARRTRPRGSARVSRHGRSSVAVQHPEQRLGQLQSLRRLNDAAPATGRAPRPRRMSRRGARRTRPIASSRIPNASISTTVRSATISFRSRGVPSATIRPLFDHGDAVAELVGLEHVVRRQQHGLAGPGQPGDRRAQLPGADRVDPDRRLVEEDDRRDRGRAPARRAAAAACRASRPSTRSFSRPASPTRSSSSAIRGFCSRAGHRVELGEVAQVVVRGEPLVQPPLAAEHVADALPHLARVLDHVESEHLRRPRGRESGA